MDKTAQTTKPILEVIATRWSPRAFTPDPVTSDALTQLLEAARWAPSSGNGQPWRFIVTHKGSAGYDALFATLATGNQTWAGAAPVLILSVAETSLIRPDKPTRANRHAFYDVGQAVAFLSLQANALGLHLHQMAGFDAEAAQQALHIPEAFTPCTVIALGYRAESETLPSALREREEAPRNRKSLSEVTFLDSWGNVYTDLG